MEDEDDVHDRPKHTLKPPRFDGKLKKLIEFERGTPRRSPDNGGFARYNRQPNLSSTPVGFQI